MSDASGRRSKTPLEFRQWVDGRYRMIRLADGEWIRFRISGNPNARMVNYFRRDGDFIYFRFSTVSLYADTASVIVCVYRCHRSWLSGKVAASPNGNIIQAFGTPQWVTHRQTHKTRLRKSKKS